MVRVCLARFQPPRLASSLRLCDRFFPDKEIGVSRDSVKVEGLTGDPARTGAREPKELDRGAHVPRPTQTVDVLVRGAVGAAAQLQPLTVEQERHHVENVQGENASVRLPRGSSRAQKKEAYLDKGSTRETKLASSLRHCDRL